MYAAVGAGYAASGTLAGGLLKVVAPSTAILWGVGLTGLLVLVGATGERRLVREREGGDRPLPRPQEEASEDADAAVRNVRR